MFSLDDARWVLELIGLGRAEAVKAANIDMLRQRFLNGRRASPFVPASEASTK